MAGRQYEHIADGGSDLLYYGTSSEEPLSLNATYWPVNWGDCVAPGFPGQPGEMERMVTQMRAHITQLSTNRCDLIIGPDKTLQLLREGFLVSCTPSIAIAIPVQLSLTIATLFETPDLQCHFRHLAYLNTVAAEYRVRNPSPRDNDFRQVENETRTWIHSIAKDMHPETGHFFPVEIPDQSDAVSAVIRLDARSGTDFSATLFVSDNNVKLRMGMSLVRTASVQCGDARVSIRSTIGVIT
jgi:hypothetical protein